MTATVRLGAAGLLLLEALFLPLGLGAASSVRFFAIGDVPYSESERPLLEELLDQERPKRPPFMVHVGDIKGGSSPCTAAAFAPMAVLFRSQPFPVVYTPGDNDWTDCRRTAAGGYDPGERLALLRRTFFEDPSVLRLQDLGARADDAAFPENVWFLHQGVLFATLHLVGSHNNLYPKKTAAMAEHEARSAANRRHLERVTTAANAANASALVLLFHADPGLDSATPRSGFGPFLDDLDRLLRDYPGPVLAVHGDTHRYKLDHPLRDPRTGGALGRFTRLVVPGSPIVAGVWVGIDSEADEVFSVELVYPDYREWLMSESVPPGRREGAMPATLGTVQK